MHVCLWSPAWSTGGASAAEPGRRPADLAPSLSELAPRLRVESEVIWADGSGLDAASLAARLLDRLARLGVHARAGVAAVPVTAELAARFGDQADDRRDAATPFLVKERTGWGWRASTPLSPGVGDPASSAPPSPHRSGEPGVVVVRKGEEAAWQATLPISALARDEKLRSLLDGVGVTTLGALAALEREAIEVRFGPDAVACWRAARADDRRVLFRRVPPERPCGSIDFVDYVLTDPARLLFTANALLGPLCARLVARGEHARALRLVLPLADGSEWDRLIRPARPTASRDAWLRLLRNLLERLTVPDAVAGMRLEVGRTEPAAVRQGDLFDRGFATAAAVEAAVARLAERQVQPLAPRTDAHPLLERRGQWTPVSPDRVTAPAERRVAPGGKAGLGLQLLPEPRRLVVETTRRRDHEIPTRLLERGGWREIAHAAGPDRISGGQWEAGLYAREYFRCVTDEGVPLWIYRDAREDGWYLHGWWD
ncbi:MAG TPA: hypothetical protein VMM12_14750 [Longimicrobiales bacterium]|nr:hypothetical protein [Longimicrobiales bacterium]